MRSGPLNPSQLSAASWMLIEIMIKLYGTSRWKLVEVDGNACLSSAAQHRRFYHANVFLGLSSTRSFPSISHLSLRRLQVYAKVRL